MKRIVFFLCMFFISIPTISASSVIVMDMGSGRVLYEKNSDVKKLIASVTKIMTISRLNQKIKGCVSSK